jgi:DNA-directed RNA polymerase specialized sigma24 family protein
MTTSQTSRTARRVPTPKATDDRMSISRRHGFVGSTPRAKTTTQKRAAQAYAAAFYDAVHGVLVRERSDALDVAGFAVERLLEHNLAGKMRQYPDPAMYGRKNARGAAIDYDRQQAADRGEGARRTTVVYSFAHFPEFDTVDATDEGIAGAVAKADVERYERLILQYVSKRDWNMFALVKRDGWTTVDVANLHGLRRETVSRIIGDVRDTLEMVLA